MLVRSPPLFLFQLSRDSLLFVCGSLTPTTICHPMFQYTRRLFVQLALSLGVCVCRSGALNSSLFLSCSTVLRAVALLLLSLTSPTIVVNLNNPTIERTHGDMLVICARKAAPRRLSARFGNFFCLSASLQTDSVSPWLLQLIKCVPGPINLRRRASSDLSHSFDWV